MNELKGKFVNIVLSVEEGRGFDSVKNPMYVTANFNGRVMESDVVEAHPNVIFNTEMVWETEKKLLRRARGAYARVRIECFTTEKRFVGFVLLCLRSAHILASSRTCLEVPFTWNRLINVPSEFKRGTPELHVSLTIRDYLTTSGISDLPPAIPPQTRCPPDEQDVNDCSHNGVDVEDDNVKIFDNKVRIPIRYGRNGFLQVGRDDEKLDRFQLKITSRMASNLDTLLPESLVFSQSPKKYHLSFDVFGTPVKTRTFSRDLHENVNVNETVVVNLLSNMQVLSAYFQQFPTVEVTFLNDHASLGRTHVDFTRFDWEMKQNELDWTRMEFEEDCEFDGAYPPMEETEQHRRRTPTLGVKAQVERLREIGQGDKEMLSPKVRYSPSPQCGELLIETKTRPQSNSVDRVKPAIFNKVSSTTNAVTETAILQSTSSPQLQPRTDDSCLDVFQQFCLDLIVENFTWRRPPPAKSTHCYFNFQHPKCNAILSVKADLERQINRRVQLERVVCKLIFISTKTRVKRLLTTHSPHIHLVDSKKMRLSQDFGVDAKLINLQNPELTQMLSLKTPKGEELADVSVSVFLEVADLEASSPKSNYELLPTILDDSVIISDLAQLERWKQEERDRFKNEMEALRRRELQVLHKDWILRKNKLENDLRNNITRCKKLSRQLKKSAHRAMIDRVVEARRKSDGGGGVDEDEDEFNLYMEIHKNAVKYSLCETHELIEKISRLERECVVLRDLLAEQELEMDEIRKDALTGEQTQTLLLDLKLLEKKYEEVQRDKIYFKSEWEKAVKEVHQLKVEDQKNLQSKIAIEKEQLSQLSLDTFITISGPPDNK